MSAIYENSAQNVTSTGAAITVTVGYTPSYVKIVNRTTGVTTEKQSNFAANTTQLTAQNGDKSYDTNSLIVLTTNGFTTAAAIAANLEVIDILVLR